MTNPPKENIDRQVFNTKLMVLVSVVAMMICVFVAYYLFVELQDKKAVLETQKKEIELKNDSLQRMNKLVSLYKDSLEYTLDIINSRYVSKADPALATNISKLLAQSVSLSSDAVTAVFDESRETRMQSLVYLLKNKRDDPATVQSMITTGVNSINDPKGTVNVLYYLNSNKPETLQKFSAPLTSYLDLVDRQVGRQQAKDLSQQIRKKISSDK